MLKKALIGLALVALIPAYLFSPRIIYKRFPPFQSYAKADLRRSCEGKIVSRAGSTPECVALDCAKVVKLPPSPHFNEGRPVLSCETPATLEAGTESSEELGSFNPFSREGTSRRYYFEKAEGGYNVVRTAAELRNLIGTIDSTDMAIDYMVLFERFDSSQLGYPENGPNGFTFPSFVSGSENCGFYRTEITLAPNGEYRQDSKEIIRGAVSDCSDG